VLKIRHLAISFVFCPDVDLSNKLNATYTSQLF